MNQFDSKLLLRHLRHYRPTDVMGQECAMPRSVHPSIAGILYPLLSLALLAGLASPPVHAQKASSACELLQVGEVEAALGAKALAKPSGAKQATPGMTADVCNVNLSGHHE